MTEQELLSLKKKIDSAKQRLAELKGRKKALLESLQSSFGCKSVEEAEKKVAQLEKQIQQLEKERDKGIHEIQTTYEL